MTLHSTHPAALAPYSCLPASLPACPPACLQYKYDLVAATAIQDGYGAWGLHGLEPGHKPGAVVGQVFTGRGPLKAIGLHTTYYSGIQFR